MNKYYRNLLHYIVNNDGYNLHFSFRYIILFIRWISTVVRLAYTTRYYALILY